MKFDQVSQQDVSQLETDVINLDRLMRTSLAMKHKLEKRDDMRKTIVAALLLSAISPAHAIYNGAEIKSPEFVRVGGICSGTVIAGKWVVTAAHCGDLTGQTVSNIDASVVNIKRTVIHPMHDGSVPRVYDISLLELDKKMPATASVINTEPAVGSIQSIAGWSSLPPVSE